MSTCKATNGSGKRCGNPAGDDGYCHVESHGPDLAKNDTSGVLKPSQVDAIEALVTRKPDENMGHVAKRAGVSRSTIYRYLRDEDFVSEYRSRVEDELGSERARVAKALVEGACSPGKGQASMQRMYWQRLGELVDKHEVSGPDGGPITTETTIPWEALSLDTRKRVMAELEGADAGDG